MLGSALVRDPNSRPRRRRDTRLLSTIPTSTNEMVLNMSPDREGSRDDRTNWHSSPRILRIGRRLPYAWRRRVHLVVVGRRRDRLEELVAALQTSRFGLWSPTSGTDAGLEAVADVCAREESPCSSTTPGRALHAVHRAAGQQANELLHVKVVARRCWREPRPPNGRERRRYNHQRVGHACLQRTAPIEKLPLRRASTRNAASSLRYRSAARD